MYIPTKEEEEALLGFRLEGGGLALTPPGAEPAVVEAFPMLKALSAAGAAPKPGVWPNAPAK